MDKMTLANEDASQRVAFVADQIIRPNGLRTKYKLTRTIFTLKLFRYSKKLVRDSVVVVL